MRLLFISSLLLLTLFACKHDHASHGHIPVDAPTDKEKELYKECIDIHDRVMPQLGELETLRKGLKDIKGDDLAAMDTEVVKVVNQALAGLNKSENIMFDWMARFKELENTERDQVQNFLQKMAQDASQMEAQFNNSFAEAKQIINN